MASTEKKILNFNIGVLGHVDSGKTSISKALSTIASTAAFDKNPQSKERGITLDLGFSSFLADLPDSILSDAQNNGFDSTKMQYTLVDCPGHASLIKTIIGGAQIIDLMMLVVDVTKGMQTQTAECLVIGEILCQKMIVVLNKVDLLSTEKRTQSIEKMKKRMLKTLENTRFSNSPIVPVSANQGSDDGSAIGISDLISCIQNETYIPQRDISGPFMFSVDHCFSIRGQGTVLTGTALCGSVSVNDTIEIPTLKETKKVKSMQMFRKPVNTICQGDRAGICVTQFDPKRLERGLICSPNYLCSIFGAVVRVHKIPYFKGNCVNKARFHVTVGHETVMATLQFFGPTKDGDIKDYKDDTDFNMEYEFQEALDDKTNLSSSDGAALQYVILEFERAVICTKDALLIGSKLDTDINLNACRIAFHGKILVPFLSKDYQKTYLPSIKIFKVKSKDGVVERMSDDCSVIVKSLLKKETNIQLFQNMTVSLSTGERGNIEGTFGQSGKIKVRIPNGLLDSTKERLATTKKGKGKKLEDLSLHENQQPVKVFLHFKKYIYDHTHKMIQS